MKSIKSGGRPFSKPPEFDDLVKDLRDKLGVSENEDGSYIYSKNWSISDVRDDKDRQYIDLVQKGGGVLGIALVGFTYVLEDVGVRFLRLAGTSAGSINTILLAAIGNKEDKKSEKVLSYLAEKDIFDFVDGHKIVKLIINFFVKYNNRFKLLSTIPIIFFSLLSIGTLFLISPSGQNSEYAIIVFYFLSILIVAFALIIALGILLYKRMGQAGLGLNPGEDFLIWLRRVLWDSNSNGKQRDLESKIIEDRVFTTKELIKKVKLCPSLHLVRDKDRMISDLTGDITIVTAELVTQNKIELPKMNELFISKKDNHPFEDAAEMVRASMAIPLFFESFYARNIKTELTDDKWNKIFKIDSPEECRFVDGGVMSNFPINIYFNPDIETPRLPTIGIDLQTEENDLESDNSSYHWNLFDFVGKIFNSSKNYYDKDFIQKNEILQKTIAKVKITDAHWLDFGMSNEKKEALFMQGAKEAYFFLLGKEWRTNVILTEEMEDDSLGFSDEAENKDKDLLIEESDSDKETIGFNWQNYKSDRYKLSLEMKSSQTKRQ